MVIILDQIILNEKKKVIQEIKKEVPGFNYTLAAKLCSLCGLLPNTYGYKLSTNLSLKLMRIFQTYKGLYDFSFFSYKKMFNTLRNKDKAYRNLRYKKGYPVNQRTRSNAKTAAKRLDSKLVYKDNLQVVNLKKKDNKGKGWSKKVKKK
uniref:Ribosomal protein S13 n=1 Tax=Heterostelium pallidum TaxID=13642 RepID=Q5ILK2_HETPA|nr:ribosomal protein S13 [Heterostelium pallidum]AAU00608.1 ribosomal protein S13 [Heterostelium pallidum]